MIVKEKSLIFKYFYDIYKINPSLSIILFYYGYIHIHIFMPLMHIFIYIHVFNAFVYIYVLNKQNKLIIN